MSGKGDFSFSGRPLKILLPPLDSNTCPMLSAEQVSTIPAPLLNKMLDDYETQDLDDMGVVLTVRDTKQHQQILCTVQWITRGEAAGFLVKRSHAEVRRKEGDPRPVRFDPRSHADDSAYQSTQTTHTCFVEEVELYIFSVRAGLTDLRDYLSKKLRNYPVYASETTALIKELSRLSEESTKDVDQELKSFTSQRIKHWRTTLNKDSDLLTALRTCIPPRDELSILLRHTKIEDAAIEEALAATRKGVTEANTTATLLEFFEEKCLATSVDLRIQNAPVGPASDRRESDYGLGGGSGRTGDAMVIFAAIRDNRILRADREGTGTMRSTRGNTRPTNLRNNDFRYARGDILVTLPKEYAQVNGDSHVVVVNDTGAMAEISKNMSLTLLQDTQDGSRSPESVRSKAMSPRMESEQRAGEKRRRTHPGSRS